MKKIRTTNNDDPFYHRALSLTPPKPHKYKSKNAKQNHSIPHGTQSIVQHQLKFFTVVLCGLLTAAEEY